MPAEKPEIRDLVEIIQNDAYNHAIEDAAELLTGSRYKRKGLDKVVSLVSESFEFSEALIGDEILKLKKK